MLFIYNEFVEGMCFANRTTKWHETRETSGVWIFELDRISSKMAQNVIWEFYKWRNIIMTKVLNGSFLKNRLYVTFDHAKFWQSHFLRDVLLIFLITAQIKTLPIWTSYSALTNIKQRWWRD